MKSFSDLPQSSRQNATPPAKLMKNQRKLGNWPSPFKYFLKRPSLYCFIHFYKSTMAETDEMVTCPYNPAHISSRARFYRHLHRCRRNYPETFITCPYNSTHNIRKEEKELHLMDCPDKQQVDAMKLDVATQLLAGFKLELPKPSEPPSVIADEDWDAENRMSNTKVYNPTIAVEKKMVIRRAFNGTKAQRKAFRAEEDARLKALKEEEEKKALDPTTAPIRRPAIPDDRNDERKIANISSSNVKHFSAL